MTYLLIHRIRSFGSYETIAETMLHLNNNHWLNDHLSLLSCLVRLKRSRFTVEFKPRRFDIVVGYGEAVGD